MLHFPSPDIGMFGRRQRHVRGHRIPVTIVTGGGAPQERDTVVVTDTFGVDEVPLGGGCACCTVRGALQTAMHRLLAEREQRPFTRVVIESSEGLRPILRTFASERALGAAFYLKDALLPGDSFTLTEDTPLSWEAFSRFMSTLQALRGADLLHVQGLLNVSGCRGPVAVQFVQHLAHRPVELQAWPDGKRVSRLAFITRNIEEKAVRGMFDAVRALT